MIPLYINRVGKLSGAKIVMQIGTSADDGYWAPGGTTFDISDKNFFGRGGGGAIWSSFLRWTGVNIPAGATLKSAIVSLYISTLVGSPAGIKLYFNDTATPTAPTTVATANAKVKTTAYANCNPAAKNVWMDIDVLAIIDELLKSYSSYSSGAMMAIIVGAGSSDSNYTGCDGYDTNPATASKLTIRW